MLLQEAEASRSPSATSSATPAACRSRRRWSSRRSTCCRCATRSRSYAMTPLQSEPGTKYQYSNAGINTAGRIIEVVSGMPYEEFLRQAPVRAARHEGHDLLAQRGAAHAAGEVVQAERGQDRPGRDDDRRSSRIRSTTASGSRCRPAACSRRRRTSARFCQMVLNGGTFEGKRYLSRSRRQADDEQADRRRRQGGLRPGLVHRRRQLRPRRRATRPNMTIDPKRGLITVLHGAARRLPRRRRQGPRRVREGGGRAIRGRSEREALTGSFSRDAERMRGRATTRSAPRRG